MNELLPPIPIVLLGSDAVAEWLARHQRGEQSELESMFNGSGPLLPQSGNPSITAPQTLTAP
jgi:hypothetical protein